MDLFELKYFKIWRLHLLVIGQWPYQKNIIAVSARLIIAAALISFGIEKICRLIKLGNDVRILIEDIPYCCLWISIAAMYISFWAQLELLKDILGKVKDDWHCAMLNKEDHILEAITKQGWKKSIHFLLLTYILASLYMTVQFTPKFLSNLVQWNTTNIREPFVGEFLLDPDKNYPLRMPYEYVVVIGTALVPSIMFVQFNMLVMHACGMFTIFGQRLEHAFQNTSEKRIKDDGVHTAFVRIIEQHKHIMQYIDSLNSYYAVQTCFIGLVSVLTVSSLLVNVCTYMRKDGNIEMTVVASLNFSGVFFNGYYFCDSAQELLNASSHVFRQTYWGEWYTASNSNQKILLLIMCNCIQPVRIAFSSIFTVSLETFYVLLQAALSFFTVLYSLQ